jgi:hypothetical protein
MWFLSFAIYFSLKWLTWCSARAAIAPSCLAFDCLSALLAGSGCTGFLDTTEPVRRAAIAAWLRAALQTLSGVTLIGVVARYVPPNLPLLRGWMGMAGLILFLRFGTFQLLAGLWQSLGVRAELIMRAPLRSTSLTRVLGEAVEPRFP